MLAQSQVSANYPIVVGQSKYTVTDLIRYEMATCKEKAELTFKLIGLSYYIDTEQIWLTDKRNRWNIEKLVQEELAQPINGAACGGTHRLTGFSYAVRKREKRGEPFEGQWLRAKKFVEDYHTYAFTLQNPDSSFSTDWFQRRADYGDVGRRLQTTGHITEWLAFSLPKDELVDAKMIKSVDYLATILLEHPNERWSIGPLGHGLHALAIYDERVFGGTPGKRAEQLALARKDKVKVKLEEVVR